MRPVGVFIALLGFDAGAVGSLPFKRHGIPATCDPTTSIPTGLRRLMREQAGLPTIRPLGRSGPSAAASRSAPTTTGERLPGK